MSLKIEFRLSTTTMKKHRPSALITGATGFIGSALAERLVREGWEITLLYRKQSDTKRIENILGEVDSVICDLETVTGPELTELTPRVDICFHLASKASTTVTI